MILQILHKDWKILQKEGIIQIKNAPKLNITRNKQLNISLSLDNYGWVCGWTSNENWLNYGLIYNYQYVSKNCEQCPQTFNILKKHIQLRYLRRFFLNKKRRGIQHIQMKITVSISPLFILTYPSQGCELHVAIKLVIEKENSYGLKIFFPFSINKSNHDRLFTQKN